MDRTEQLDSLLDHWQQRQKEGRPVSTTQKVLRLLAVLLICLLVPACKDKVTKANFDKVKEGMSLEEVQAILGKGEKFESLAKQSKDPGSASNGGDLGWNTASTFVKEFSDAMVALDKGKTVDAPVKTQFGYHVIRLDDVRDAAPPPLEQVEPQIQQQLERQKIQSLQKELRNSAKVE